MSAGIFGAVGVLESRSPSSSSSEQSHKHHSNHHRHASGESDNEDPFQFTHRTLDWENNRGDDEDEEGEEDNEDDFFDDDSDEMWDELAESVRLYTMKELVYGLFEGLNAPQYPRWTRASRFFFYVSMMFIVASIISFTIETLPVYLVNEPLSLNIIEQICVAYFTFEFVVRFATCPNRRDFMKRMMNWIDILSIVPFYVDIIVAALTSNSSSAQFLVLGRVLRLVRVARVIKLSKHSLGMQAVVETFVRSEDALTLLMLIFLIALMLFSAAIFYAEQENSIFDPIHLVWVRDDGTLSAFQSIPHSFWWTVVTITTVGYGDMVPQTPSGKAVASAALVCGIFVIAFPTIILGANFQEIYARKVHEARVRPHHHGNMSPKATYKGAALSASIRGPNLGGTLTAKTQEWYQPRGSLRESGLFFMYGKTKLETRSIYHETGRVYCYDPLMEFRCIPGTSTLDIKMEESTLSDYNVFSLILLLDCVDAREIAVEVVTRNLASSTSVRAGEDKGTSDFDIDDVLSDDGNRSEEPVVVKARPVSRIQAVANIAEYSPLMGSVLTTRDFMNPCGSITLTVVLPPGVEAQAVPTNIRDVSFTFAVSYSPQSTVQVPLNLYQSSGIRRRESTIHRDRILH